MSRPRESSSQAIKIEVDAVHPDPSDALEEYRVSLAFLPIRLHLDQRHVDFCTEFFSPRPSAPPPRDTNLMDEGLYHKHSPNGTLPFALEMSESATEPLLPFFQVCEVLPFTIRVDYLPHRVDLAALRGGNYVELVNLVPWKA
jgi:autophagy-related protein 2